MQITYREQAKALIEALALNAISKEEIIDWSDTMILKFDEPRLEFIELSMSKKNVNDVITNLNLLAVGADEELAYRLLFKIFSEALKTGRSSYQDISKRLYFWTMYESELDKYRDLATFWDEIDLSDLNGYGDPKEVRNRMLNLLDQYKI